MKKNAKEMGELIKAMQTMNDVWGFLLQQLPRYKKYLSYDLRPKVGRWDIVILLDEQRVMTLSKKYTSKVMARKYAQEVLDKILRKEYQ